MEGNVKSLVALLCHKLSEDDTQLLADAVTLSLKKHASILFLGGKVDQGKLKTIIKISEELHARRNPIAEAFSVDNAAPIATVDGAANFSFKHLVNKRYYPSVSPKFIITDEA
ncbi:MAG: hypothetical protein AAF927_01815 [Bacteroidota bacterium]